MARGEENVGLVLAFVGIGGVAAYATNYAGFKDWIDYQIGRPREYQEPNPDDEEGKWDEEFKDEPKKKVNPPPPRKANCYYLGSNCQICKALNTVEWKGISKGKTQYKANKIPAGWTDQQACSQIAKLFVATCNATSPPPPKPTCSCPWGKVNPILTGKDCTAACCRLYGNARCSTKNAVLNSKNQCVCTTTATVVHNSNCTSVENSTCWKSSGCYNGKTGIYATCISGRGRCTDARAAFVKKYGCPVYFAQAYPAVHNNYAQVPTVA